ncbi:MAG: bifunctional [glutamate--ammonia ligase]-adenylyl-L-tyrosine phosphorylase/[glutamate--ammonia-ligase] adenylyltransferase [Bacteroidales bacterium]|nr:bifunctional [glutamate--ammonia ligase]-adenylyl-L-tyrosine phosphorylase/[glutamate--ammonia-ligase] adenylyltransferase [Bacteroidales bacterium]
MSFSILLPILHDQNRGRKNLDRLAVAFPGDTGQALLAILQYTLPRLADPDMAVNNLDRVVADSLAMTRLRTLLTDHPAKLEQVLHLFSTSQFFADTLMAFPEALDFVESVPQRSPSTIELQDALRQEIETALDDSGVLRAFRRFRQLQMIRVGVNDIIRDRPLEEITRDLARVADASVEIALQTALRTAIRKYGTPLTTTGIPTRVTVLAFGKLGGDELNYSSDIDLMVVYDCDGYTTGNRSARITNAQFFGRVVTEIIRLLSSHAEGGFAYRVDLRLRPEGNRGPLARSLPSTLSYYDVMGRTWERQALIKVRPCAGDLDLGWEFVRAIEPFVYRKYFSFSEINEVKALKRQMEKRSTIAGVDDHDVKTGRGGIRDIEYTVQFLQLLNGGDLPAVRQRNTLLALESLEIAGCLTGQETYILADAYRFLRKVEHRLQLLFDWQTHTLPTTESALTKLALRMGYARTPQDRLNRSRMGTLSNFPQQQLTPPTPQKRSRLDEHLTTEWSARSLLIEPLDRFLGDYHEKTRMDRTILDHLLHMAFSETDERSEPETDLILQPEPDEETIRTVLGRYAFKDLRAAYQCLTNLAREAVPFLSHRRCRHFLASIAPRLLRTLAETSDPDLALNNLDHVTASLGAKAVLYELFNFNPASLKLYVDLCASSPYLSAILTNNPGMIDELLDSLLLDQLRPREELQRELTELLRGASDPDPILHSFQDKELLRIGVRDLLRRDTIRHTTAALSDLADVILNAVLDLVELELQSKLSVPMIPQFGQGTSELRPCRYAIVGLGKLGGQEISYHSDLDLILVYETDPSDPNPNSMAKAGRYFTELAQRVIRRMTEMGPLGRLYTVDMRLRPTGKSGSLAVPLVELRRYFLTGGGETWERLSLTRARVIRGDTSYSLEVIAEIQKIVTSQDLDVPHTVQQVQSMRSRLEAAAKPGSLKHGNGGLADIEFVVQMLQMIHGRLHPTILRTNVWDAIAALEATGLLTREDGEILIRGYAFLRRAEAGLRIMTDRAILEIPDAISEREKLARRLGYFAESGAGAVQQFDAELAQVREQIRTVFERLVSQSAFIRKIERISLSVRTDI